LKTAVGQPTASLVDPQTQAMLEVLTFHSFVSFIKWKIPSELPILAIEVQVMKILTSCCTSFTLQALKLNLKHFARYVLRTLS